VSDTVTGFGVLGLIIGIALAAYGSGRVGPATKVKNSSSCCGCSCLVLVVVLPTATTLLWLQHGALVAAAIVPAALAAVRLVPHAARIIGFQSG